MRLLKDKETVELTRVPILATSTVVFDIDEAQEFDRLKLSIHNRAESDAALDSAALQYSNDFGQTWTALEASTVTAAIGSLAVDGQVVYKTGTLNKRRVRLVLTANVGEGEKTFIDIAMTGSKLPLDAEDLENLVWQLAQSTAVGHDGATGIQVVTAPTEAEE